MPDVTLVTYAFLAFLTAALASADASESTNGICGYVFDFDNTVTQEIGGELARDVAGIVQSIHDRGYPIAIATASCSTDIPEILQSQVNGEVFNEGFFESPAFQSCNIEKNVELAAITSHFKLDPQCTVLLDDSSFNAAFAEEAGVIFKQVQFGVGVTWQDFEAANATLHRTCNCTNIPPWTAPEQAAGTTSKSGHVEIDPLLLLGLALFCSFGSICDDRFSLQRE
eukprot:TRINITY_DN8660_c0_g1_i1.p1 TRINITY_DN8660_c0_g1~~TRINITY_DN8660_c0_g1_i1.p1  ORF type:complete len:226 (-),score=16.91 TRINITY_DN8660_c0_g1_i1:188-865(-)